MNQQTEVMKNNVVKVAAQSGQLSEMLPGNRLPMDTGEQKAALKKAQQAEKRVKLGMELLKASESRLSAQTQMLNAVRREQKQLREQVHGDMAKSLQSYDQWLGQIDESFSKAIQMLEEKVDTVMGLWEKKEKQLDDMTRRFERLFEQNQRTLMDIKMHHAAGANGGEAMGSSGRDRSMGDEEEMTAEEEAEIEMILKGELVVEAGASDPAEEVTEPIEAEEVVAMNDEVVIKKDPAAALAELAEKREEEAIFSTVLRDMKNAREQESDD
ncbi:hypothetical protein KS4_20240 [Poriferisphaera corsica]|uniref:Uncharacterized protein n=1 Tax=Poriferisphaera corsica TaxID=2528020 RepID=A0A517YUR5_9BACT|nr:hypothetical protein [Poriferisphaera corsica]QDU33964.1 hypothetical protein KS4_20240 [Poriferisphaera corsica]